MVLAALVRRSLLALLVDLNVSPSAFAVQVPIASMAPRAAVASAPRYSSSRHGPDEENDGHDDEEAEEEVSEQEPRPRSSSSWC